MFDKTIIKEGSVLSSSNISEKNIETLNIRFNFSSVYKASQWSYNLQLKLGTEDPFINHCFVRNSHSTVAELVLFRWEC